MNLNAAHLIALDTYEAALDDELAGLDALDGVKKKLKRVTTIARKVSLTSKVHDANSKLFQKVAPKPVYQLKRKAERVAKRNALTIAAAAATIATGGAAAPALIAAAQKAAGSEAVRAAMKRKAKVDQRKAVKAANAEADRIAADYEREQDQQDAASNVVPLRAPVAAATLAPTGDAMTGDYIPKADADDAQAAAPAQWIPGLDNKWLYIGGGALALLLLRR